MTIVTRSYTQSKDPTIVICPEGGCIHCTCRNQDGSCESINDTKNKTNVIVLLEPDRHLIHFANHGESIPDMPPRVSQNWETAYVKQFNIRDSQRIASIYSVGPYVSIFSYDHKGGIVHKAIPHVKTAIEFEMMEIISEQSVPNYEGTFSIDRRIEQRKLQLLDRISEMVPEISDQTKQTIAELLANQRSILGPFFPLLMDENVEDIFLDRPGTQIYFDHRHLGRCVSTVKIGQDDGSKIITLLRAESNYHLDRLNPSLKTDLRIKEVRLRFSATIPPLSPDGLHLEIRRARRSPFTLYDLVQNSTLSVEAAALLLLGYISRFNITIAGEPGTGKTTLLNALDMCTPRTWRKIYIEDAIESRIQRNHHQIRFQVSPIDETRGQSSKIGEITKTLHRSPDYLILGEIQTADHSKALFQSLLAGLRSVQTCHSSSAAALVSRWRYDHGIEEHAIALMDLIVVLYRPEPGKSRRIVKEIVEIRREVKDGFLRLQGLNLLYKADESRVREWANDGAFISRAKEFGETDPTTSYQKLIEILKAYLDKKIETHWTIGEKLWENGSPFAITEWS